MPDPENHGQPAPRPLPTLKLDPIAARRQLDAFVAIVRQAVSAAKQHAKPVAANSVVVDRTGKSYPNITAALASITDASKQRQYVLLIGPGA